MSSKNSKVVSMPLAELVEDMDLYPRHAVDASHVQALVFALESGANLPPVTVDKKSKRITDGWHRRRAYQRFLGPEAVIDVELVDYGSESEMVLDAVSRNAAHGRKLDAIDRTRSVIMLRTGGFDDSQISAAMHIPEGRVERLMIKVAKAPKSSSGLVPGTYTISLKRCVHHLEGKSLTKDQAEIHAMLPGTSFLLIARQLCRALSGGMVDLEDERLVAELIELRDVLSEKLAETATA